MEKLLQKIRQLDIVPSYKIYIQKSVAFLCNNNTQYNENKELVHKVNNK